MPPHPETVRVELDADPLGRSYAGMADSAVSADLNTAYREQWASVTASDILEAITPAHLTGLSTAKRADVDTVLSMGGVIDLSAGSRARVMLTTAFAGKPGTLNALESVGRHMITRAAELSCLVTSATVTVARAL